MVCASDLIHVLSFQRFHPKHHERVNEEKDDTRRYQPDPTGDVNELRQNPGNSHTNRALQAKPNRIADIETHAGQPKLDDSDDE